MIFMAMLKLLVQLHVVQVVVDGFVVVDAGDSGMDRGKDEGTVQVEIELHFSMSTMGAKRRE